jgi:Mo-co oxidoreductase dimerisation domain.
MVMGSGQWHWVRQLGRPSRSDHAAGDGEPVRRHGQRAAGHADGGLTPATQTTDTSPPTTTITSPSQGATFPDGTAVTISGTATDAGGGVVAGVEVSTDGSTWHPATTMSAADTSVTWSYSWIAHGYPSTTINARAVDDSGNRGNPGQGDTVNVTCPCSIWGTTSPRKRLTPTTRPRSTWASNSRRASPAP